MPNQITSWSFSRFSDYRQCPAKAKYKHVMKMPEPSNPAMERGILIHKLAEDYIKGKLRALPSELVKFMNLFKALRALYKKKIRTMDVEESWAFTKDWGKTRYDDWTGCHLRIKMDCASQDDDPSTLVIRDWKTGRYRDEQNESYVLQLSLYAVGAFHTHKHVKTVIPQLVYLDHGIVYPSASTQKTSYTRKELPMLTKDWERRVKPMLNDTVFAPTPSDHCRWCHYRKSNGGPCQY